MQYIHHVGAEILTAVLMTSSVWHVTLVNLLEVNQRNREKESLFRPNLRRFLALVTF
jgi:hypothetical protein